MKRILLSLLAGVGLGAGFVWLALHRPASAEPKTETSEKPEAHDPLHLDAEAQARAGLIVQRVTETNVAAEIRGYARVLDSAPLLQQANDLAVARVIHEASRKEWERLKTLFAQGQNASARAMESGEAALKRDEALAAGAEARLLANWGPTLARRPDLTDLSARLARFDAALVRVEIPLGVEWEGNPRSAAVAFPTDPDHRTPAEWLGPAPSIDPLTQGKAFLALIATHGFTPGIALDAVLASPGPTRRGAFIPVTAVVRHDGGTYIYVAGDAGHFARRPVTLEQPLAGGWLVINGLTNGQSIVVTGAQVLLSNELKSAGAEE